MPGPEEKKLKAVCFDCRINKWCVDFKEGSSSKISTTSVCLFCELKQKAYKQEREIKELKKAQEGHEYKVGNLEKCINDLRREMKNLTRGSNDSRDSKDEHSERKVNKEDTNTDSVVKRIEEVDEFLRELKDTTTENGISIVEIRKEMAARKDKGAKDPANEFTLVKGKKAAKPGKFGKQVKSVGVSTSNRFSHLSCEEEESILLGDSMVKGQGNHFGDRNIKKRKVSSFPGSNVSRITQEVTKLNLRSRKSTVIVHAGGNDLFLRGGQSR